MAGNDPENTGRSVQRINDKELDMVSKELTIKNELGMHMRPASLLAKMAAGYASNVTIKFNGKDFNCKSVMLLMTALLKCGSEFELVCDGPDEEKALAEIAAFIDSGMGD